MKVGELFVNLGITGADKTISLIGQTTKGMSGLASMSLEAKAAILAAIYGLERMMSSSADMGSHLTNLSTLLGISSKTLQQYDYAAQQVGISNGEMEGSFKSLQTAMANIDLNKGAPEWAAIVGGRVGIDFNRKNDLDYMMRKLQQFAQLKDIPEAWKRQMLSSFGLSEGVIAAMERNAFRPDVFAKAPLYSDSQIKQLDHVRAQWANLWQSIEMQFGKFTARHGNSLIKDIKTITDAFFRMAESLQHVSEQYKLFEKLAWAVKQLAGAMDDLTAYSQGKKDFWGNEIDPKTGKPKEGTRTFSDWFFGRPAHMDTGTQAAPPVTAPSGGSSQQNNININQSLNFQHDGTDHKKVTDSHKKAVRDAYQQIPALVRGS
jgi:hypothetical protein